MANEEIRDGQTVNASGESLARLPAGVQFREQPLHIDARGSVRELYDLRWNWHPDPVVFSYVFTVRPGYVKGWGVHREHEDRYCLILGELLVVLYDERPESPTRGLVSEIVLSEYRGRIMNIPAGVWHADQNIGSKDAVVVNFPTIPYDHTRPDKYRLPLNNDRIPYKFKNISGW